MPGQRYVIELKITKAWEEVPDKKDRYDATPQYPVAKTEETASITVQAQTLDSLRAKVSAHLDAITED
jgi:hypothetical protein